MKGCRFAGLHGDDVTEDPQQKIQRVNGLIDQSPAAVESARSAPAGVLVVVRRAIPFHSRVGENRFAERTGIHAVFQAANAGLEAVLKKHSEFYVGLSSF